MDCIRTIFLVHFLNLEIVCADTYVAVVELVPECRSSEKRAREISDRMEPQTVHNQRNIIRKCREEKDDRKVGPGHRREQSHLTVTFIHRS